MFNSDVLQCIDAFIKSNLS